MAKKVVILGGTIAGVSAASTIRSSDPDADISIITTDNDMPYCREYNPELISGEKDVKDILYKDRSFYESNRINIINEKKITRINFNKKKLYLEDRFQIDFNFLILTDSIYSRYTDLKGSHREGLYGIRKLTDISAVVENMPFIDTVVVQSGCLSGVRMADAFTKRGKETILVVSPKDGLLGSIEKDVLDSICSSFENKQFSIEKDNGIEELLGEKEIKAIKLSSGRVLATDIVIIGEADDDLRFLSGQDLNYTKKIEVDEFFRTNIENVFALGHLIGDRELEYYGDLIPGYVLEDQGRIAGQSVLGNLGEINNKINISRKFEIADTSFVFIGQTKKSSKVVEIFRYFKESNKYIKIFIKDNVLIGAILVNEQNQEDKFKKIIQDGLDVRKVESFLLEDSYSFEDIKSAMKNSASTCLKGEDNVTSNEDSQETAFVSSDSSEEAF